MATVVGELSAVLAIAVEFSHLYTRLCECVRTLKHARDDIENIGNEVEIFSNLLSMFHRVVTDTRLADEGLSAKIKESKLEQGIFRSGKTALRKINDILATIEPLRTDVSHSVAAQWLARVKWSRRKDEWVLIQTSLNSVKCSATLLIQMVYFQDIVHRFGSLRATQRTMSSDMLQQL